MTRVRKARLLDGDLKEKERLYAKAQSVSLSLTPLSTASISLMERSSAAVRDYVEVYTARGTAGIYRVVSKEAGYGTGGDVLRLEHGICVLGDAVTPEKETLKGTYEAVLGMLMRYQTAKANGVAIWTLGNVEIPSDQMAEYETDGATTLNAIMDVMDMIDGYFLEFDQTVFPWVMHVKKMEEEASCEGRLSRNVKTARITMDDSELCTRVECNRLKDGYMQLESEPKYGIVTRRLNFSDETSDEKVEEECRRYLERRKTPQVSIEIDGLELSAITGEALDRFDVGKMMRLALPEYGIVVNERVIAVNYAQAIERPEQVTVTLNTAIKDASNSLAGISGNVDSLKNTATGYGNRISSSEKKITNLKDTAEGIEEINGKMTHWFNSVEIDLNAQEAQLGLLASRAETTANSNKINQAFLILDGDTEAGGSSVGLVARVTQNEADLSENALKVAQVSEAVVSLEATTDTSVAMLLARVDDNEASITATATELGSQIDLKADRTYVQKLIADEISAIESEIGQLTGGTVQASHLYTQNLTATNTVRLAGHTCVWKKYEVVTSASLSKSYQNVPGGNGVTYTVIGGVSLSTETEEIKYLGRD